MNYSGSLGKESKASPFLLMSWICNFRLWSCLLFTISSLVSEQISYQLTLDDYKSKFSFQISWKFFGKNTKLGKEIFILNL